MLTDLQQRIAQFVLATASDPDLAMAGGAALISLGLVDRGTTDIDFFTTAARVETTVDELIPALVREGFTVERERVTPTFARLVVSEGHDVCRVDIAQDYRLIEAASGSFGRILAAEELAADKTLALFSRAEPRDFVDVYFLARRFGKNRLLDLAREKDTGFDTGVFAQMLGTINRLDRDEFAVDDTTFAELQAFFADWRSSLDADN